MKRAAAGIMKVGEYNALLSQLAAHPVIFFPGQKNDLQKDARIADQW
jgi:hypothetical protein